MNGIEFYLFRIKITKPEQVSFFHEVGLSKDIRNELRHQISKGIDKSK